MGTLTIDCEEVKQYRDRFLNGSVTRIYLPESGQQAFPFTQRQGGGGGGLRAQR